MRRRPASREHLLAVDLGTTGVRALVVHVDGEVLGRSWQPLSTRFPGPGRVEQDPDVMWRRSQTVLHRALAEAGLEAVDLAGIGVAAQRSTALAWDGSSGTPLGPALVWQDTRTKARVAELRKSGIPINTMASATKFEWILEQVPGVSERARRGSLRLGTPDAWLSDRLTGGAAFITDPGQASCTGLWDLAGAIWLPAALQLFGVDVTWLPRVVPSASVVAETRSDLLGTSVPVAARAGDQQAASFAQGLDRPGLAKLTLGTSAMLDVHTGPTPAQPPRGAHPLALWDLGGERGRAFCLEGTVVTAGATVDWLVDLGLLTSARHLDAVATQVESSQEVVLVPALAGLGTPHVDPAAYGLILGLTRGSRSAHLVRAAIDGVAQRCVDVCEALPLADEALRVDGGLARSDLLLQTLADLSGHPMWRAAELETTALGAAALAGLAVGLYDAPDGVGARVEHDARFEPRLSSSERERRRERWHEAVERCRA